MNVHITVELPDLERSTEGSTKRKTDISKDGKKKKKPPPWFEDFWNKNDDQMEKIMEIKEKEIALQEKDIAAREKEIAVQQRRNDILERITSMLQKEV